MKTYSVYVHIFPDGKKYFGCSCDVKSRWSGNGKNYSPNQEMFEAILFHGWGNIKHEVLYSGLSLEEARRIESDLIIQNRTFEKEYGYNKSQGLANGVKYHSDEGIERIRLAMSTRIISEESRAKMSNAKKGTAYHTQKHTEETKALISKSRKGKYAKENHPMAKAVRCIETGVVYPYAKAAEELTGVSRTHICQVCKGKRKTAGKLHWEYAKKEAM